MYFTSPITNTNTHGGALDSDFPYSVPSRQCEPIIDCAILNFHDKTIPNPLSSKLSTENEKDQCQDHLTFGLLNLKIRDEIPIAKNLEINYMVDCSASMAEYAADKNTKMFHVLHTLKNMITIFHKLDKKTNIKLKVNSFDNKTYTNADTGDNNVSESDLSKLLEQLNLIEPRGSTNIELALLHTNTNSNSHLQNQNQHIKVDKIHLFLTDGCITAGSENVDYLKTLVSPHYTNYFIGYGLDHDAALLTELASTGKHNEYRFVDALEKAGLVYGEIIHDILYKALEDVVLSATNCEIYDYQTNTWTQKLEIGHLSSEQKKTYQIRAADPDKALIAISARSLHKTRAHQQLIKDVVFQTHASCVSKKCDLSDYFLRQQTQELLYKVKDLLSVEHKDKISNQHLNPDPNDLYAYYNLNPTPDHLSKEKNQEKEEKEEKEEKRKKIQEQKVVLKEELKTFLNFLLDYITLHKKEKDIFLRTLCDDIFIAYKTINSIKGAMFVNSRQTSQGRQQTYSAKSNFDDTNPNQQIPSYLRQASVSDPLSVDLDMLPPSPPKMQRTSSLASYKNHINNNGNDYDYDNLIADFDATNLDASEIKYRMTQDDDSAYASIGVVKMMRDVSMGSYSTHNPDPDPDHVPDTKPINLTKGY